MRLRSCRTGKRQHWGHRFVSMDTQQGDMLLTGHTCKKLPRKELDVRARKGSEVVALEKVKDALAVEICNDADVVPPVKCVSKVDALVAIGLVVLREGVEHSKLDSRGISVLLYGSDDLDSDLVSSPPVVGLDNLSESALAKQAYNGIYEETLAPRQVGGATTWQKNLHRSVRSASGLTM
jgi:hypothetical protein